LAGTLDLRHVSAVELDMTNLRQRLGDTPREGDRDEPVASTPDEQCIGLQAAQAGPEAVLAGVLPDGRVASGNAGLVAAAIELVGLRS